MIVNGNRQHFFGGVLTDNIFVKTRFDFFRREQFEGVVFRGVRFFVLSFENIVALLDALVANGNPVGTLDEFQHFVLALSAERTILFYCVFFHILLIMAGIYYFIYDTVSKRFFRGHKVVAVGVAFDNGDILPRHFREIPVHFFFGFRDVLCGKDNIACLTLCAAQRLVNHNLAVGKRVAFALRAGGKKERAHRRGQADRMVLTSHLI